jgi:UbiD family decarboxylase
MKDMREYLSICEEKGLLKRITAEVDPYLELSHIAKLNEEAQGPALLFENVKGHDSPVLTSASTTVQRLAIIMGEPEDSSLFDLYAAWAEKAKKPIPPVFVYKSKAPCKENIMMGDDIELNKIPVPH